MGPPQRQYRRAVSVPACSASGSTRTRVIWGATSFSNSSHLPAIGASLTATPVALPPGRERLATKPLPTGSLTFVKTIGIVRVSASRAASTGPPTLMMTSGFSATSSLALVRIRSRPSPENRCSIVMLRPSNQPSSRRPSTRARVCRTPKMFSGAAGRGRQITDAVHAVRLVAVRRPSAAWRAPRRRERPDRAASSGSAHALSEARRAVTSISIFMRGSTRPQMIAVAAGRIVAKASPSTGMICGQSAGSGT